MKINRNMIENNHNQLYEGKDILNNLITYFAFAVPRLQEVKLNKLIYIAHLYHYSRYGRLLTHTRFFSLGYGPHAPVIRSALKEQLERNAVYFEESQTSDDPVYSNPCLIIKPRLERRQNLPALCLNTIEEVVEDWRDKDFQCILDYATRTFPYLATRYREHIDFSIIDPSDALRCALPLTQRLQLHRFVQAPEEVQDDNFTCGEALNVSIGELTEIYLALCGDLPDKIPSRENLGFNHQAVMNSIQLSDICIPNSNAEHTSILDQASKLTHALIDTMSFKSYSSRVALTAGMLFLKKNGYHFTIDVLEKSWPQSYLFSAIREWFYAIEARAAPKIYAGG